MISNKLPTEKNRVIQPNSVCVKSCVVPQLQRYFMTTRQHPQDFDILWVCSDCGYSSLYHNDLEDHKYQNNHHNVFEIDLETGKLLARYAQNND